ncbi:ABC transporter substrate-binding protein [Paenibacillus radicis (ex Xue et al. 2023)]|uniref:ABC transporter substrate-binding protein n=1 Tax=Paenibacillus radicis (ex Xue et al. 2023) TaxID=2972489 RepID=A0ABT1YHF4_9BACL|nr:ABC transporter substrate-binding protein [Paenibacillus radicis (ex Xue et al. 2023)]MCR8632616.1 ABC transporter substrate-binding protein [Paenibacillus radicis (ex Xue et al. 2023)]
MKKWGAILSVAAICSVLVTGCGTNAAQQAPAGDKGAAAGKEAGLTPEKQLVIAGNGATVEELMKDEIFKKFNAKYPDVKLTYVSGVSTEIVAKVKAQKASPQIDVTIVEGGEQEAGRVEGLWEPLTDKDIPNMKKVGEDLKVKDNSGIAVNFTPMGISYNAEIVKSKGLPVPQSWNDLAKPEMKGNITLAEMSSNFGRSAFIMLAYANGGSEKNMDPGFEKLKTIAGYMPTFAKSAAQLQQNLQNKTAAYTTWTMARSLVQKDAGLDLEFVIPKEGANLVPNVATIVKGAKNPNASKLFIDFLLTDEVQTMYASKLYYNPAVPVNLPQELAKKLSFDSKKVVKFDAEVVGSKMPEWLDRFNKEVAPKVGK